MLDILFSLQFLGFSIAIVLLSTALAYLCSLLHKHLLYITSAEWLMEHVYCPVARVLLLLLIAFMMFPLIVESTSYADLLNLFVEKDFLINTINILFVASLLFAFIPFFNHPAIAMPLLGCIAIGLLFFHQVIIPQNTDIQLFPSIGTSFRIVLLMIAGYLICRWLSNHLADWIDYRFNVTGSKSLVSDSSHLVFQMPVMLAYGHSLHLQT